MKKNLNRQVVWKHIRNCLRPESLIGLGIGIAGCLILGYLFYDSWLGAVGLSPLVVIVKRYYRKWSLRRRRQELLSEFKELLYTLSANLKTGYSIENAWINAGKDLRLLYPQGSILAEEAELAAAQLKLNVPIEKAIYHFAKRCDEEVIYRFASVVETAKRSGGNLVHMLDKTIHVITEKIEVDQEIQTILSGKKMEQRIMCVMPVGMLLYLKLTNPSYLEIMYHNWLGIWIMSVCMIGTGLAVWWGNRIVEIEV